MVGIDFPDAKDDIEGIGAPVDDPKDACVTELVPIDEGPIVDVPIEEDPSDVMEGPIELNEELEDGANELDPILEFNGAVFMEEEKGTELTVDGGIEPKPCIPPLSEVNEGIGAPTPRGKGVATGWA
jgi:hypothetical protein